MHILITGGAGFIGSHLADALAARGERIVILDDLSTGRRENIQHLLEAGGAELVVGSVTDEGVVDDLMRDTDWCLHLASAVGVKLIVSRPLESLLGNVRGCDVVTAAVARHGKRLLFASSSEVYGKRNGALAEDADRVLGSPSTARWTYSTAKALGEMLAYGYFNERGAKTVVVRLFNTVGPRQSGSYGMVLPRFAQQALAGTDATVYGDGTQTRCFSHVHDTVEAILCLVDAEVSSAQAFNVGSSQEISVAELAQRVIARAGSGSGIRFVPYEQAYPPGFEELGARVPDTSAIEELTGWSPQRSVDEAIDDVIAYERARGELAPAMSENAHPAVNGHPAALGRAREARPVD